MTTAESVSAPTARAAPPLSRGVKWAYGTGAVANGVNAAIMGTFTLLFYNQVIGLPANMVALAITIALVFDAFADPLVGQISDNFRSRWGRRHPFMFISLFFYPVAFFLLWNPPAGLDQSGLFAWLVACLIGVRVFDTFFELPQSALLPELVTNYNERTSLLGLRYFFGVLASIAAPLLAYQVFMREGPGGVGGIDERGGWAPYSIACAAIIVVSILISTFGTARRIPYLRQPPPKEDGVKRNYVREILSTLNNRNFIVATISGMFAAIASGLGSGLNLYFTLYFWELNQNQLSVLALASAAGTVIGILASPILSRLIGKKIGGMAMYACAIAVGFTPILLRLYTDILPPNGSSALFAIIFAEVFFRAILGIATVVILSALVADIVEDSEVKTGRRSEGLLLSADNLFKKMVSGAGILASGWILTAVNFPQHAARTGVSDETLEHMASLYVPVGVALWIAALLSLSFFRINRAQHEENLRQLGDRAGQPAE